MNRRSFLKALGVASIAAANIEMVLSKTAAASVIDDILNYRGFKLFNKVEVGTLRAVVRGLYPADHELRISLGKIDPNFDPVRAIEEFTLRQNETYRKNVKLLIGFMEVLPTFIMRPQGGLVARPLSEIRDPKEIQRFFSIVQHHKMKQIRGLMRAIKVLGFQPMYTHEKSTWGLMNYAGPWVAENDAAVEYVRPTSFSLAQEMDDNLDVLQSAIVDAQSLRGLKAAKLVSSNSREATIETDILIIGTGAGGGVAAAELAEHANSRVLIVEKGSFIHPKNFLQREKYMVPKVLMDLEIASDSVLGFKVPNLNAAVVRGKLVGGSMTINHALSFDIPQKTLAEWNSRYGVGFSQDVMAAHFAAIRSQLRIKQVERFQVNRNNDKIRVGCENAGIREHGIADRNVAECRACGHCDSGCRYNRKQTSLNVLLPLAAKHGAQLIPDCDVERFNLVGTNTTRGLRPLRVESVTAWAIDPVSHKRLKRLTIIAKKIVLSAGAVASSRILLKSGLGDLRESAGLDSAVGKRFSCHAPCTIYGDFVEPIVANRGGPPQSYYFAEHLPSNQYSDYRLFKMEGIFNHPMVMAQLMPFKDVYSHWSEFMKRYNHIMTAAIIFKDYENGRIDAKGIDYSVAPHERDEYIYALQTMAKVIFAAGATKVFLPAMIPTVMNSPKEIPEKINRTLLDEAHLMITSAHPMGGNALGDSRKRDVLDPYGQSWDVEGLFVADSSVFPTSVGANPMLTVLGVTRAIVKEMLKKG